MKKCKNKEHAKPCNRNDKCEFCGIPTCTANFAYHVCCKKDGTPLIEAEKRVITALNLNENALGCLKTFNKALKESGLIQGNGGQINE